MSPVLLSILCVFGCVLAAIGIVVLMFTKYYRIDLILICGTLLFGILYSAYDYFFTLFTNI